MGEVDDLESVLVTDCFGGFNPETVSELCQATDLTFHATKQMTCAIGHSMAASVATERPPWLTLTRTEISPFSWTPRFDLRACFQMQ